MTHTDLDAVTEILYVGSENCLAIGTRVAEFEITGIVGEGGFGIVYLAFDHSLQRTVALKEYMPGVMAGRGSDHSVLVRSKRHQDAFETGLRSFINEARLLAQFDHPALIKIHRFWEQNNTGYMAMRFYEGSTLKKMLQNDPRIATEAWLKLMLRSILQALEALYRVQILHRDISPENIMIQHSGEAVLLDFGAARQIINDMTQALTVILKPGYAPIEQYADDPSMLQGPWTDIYSLSAVMYVAITGKNPPSSVARMIQDPIESLAGGAYPAYGRQFLHAIDQGLAVKPEHRPQSIAIFRSLLGIEEPTQAEHVPVRARADSARSAHSADVMLTRQMTVNDPHDNVTNGPTTAGAIGKGPARQTRAAAKVAPVPAHAAEAAVGVGAKYGKAAMPAMPAMQPVPSGGAVVRAPTPAAGPAKADRAGVATSKVTHLKPGTGSGAVSAHHRMRRIRMPLLCIGVVLVGAALAYRGTHQGIKPALPVAAPIEQLVDDETMAWEILKQGKEPGPAAVTAFLAKYPAGQFSAAAKALLAKAKPTELPGIETGSVAATIAPVGTPTGSAVDTATVATDQTQATSAEAATGSVQLSIKPWGNVLVDGVAKGVSPPLKRLQLSNGPHEIKVSNPNFPDYVAHVEISRKKPVRVTVDFAPATN